MKTKEKFNVEIDRLNHQGQGICKIQDHIVFIKQALPQENVEIIIEKINKKFIEASITSLNKKSKDRIEVTCPYYEKCGGCDIMHMNYESQLKFKNDKIKDIIKKYTHENIKINNIVSKEQYNYRNKVTFQVKEKIGFYKEKTYEIIDVKNCQISSKKINEILKILRTLDLKNINKIVIRTTNYNNETMVILNTKEKIKQEIFVEKLKHTVNSIYTYNKNYELIYGEKYIIEKLGNLKFIISPDSFFQVNTNMTYELYSIVKKYCDCNKNDYVLDLYCGTGTIGLFLADTCKELIGIEINKYAIKDANNNKELNKIKNAQFICGDSGKILKQLKYKPNIVIVDPPRSGLDTLAINQVISLKPEKIVYVSCDPMTLARDLNILKEHYNIIELTPVDMFPNTHHVESVVLLQKKD